MQNQSLWILSLLPFLGISACGGGGGAAAVNTAPVANFAFACSDLACTFTNTSTDGDAGDTVSASKWTFGDASSDVSTRDATHTYAAGGTYDVVLNVTDSRGAAGTVTQKVTVTAPNAGAAPHAAFTAVCASLDCTFTDTSTYDAGSTFQSREWDFGDGTGTATASPATHRYSATTLTTYTVKLSVTDAAGNVSTSIQSLPVAPPASTLNCVGGNCALKLTQAATVTATLVSRSCTARDNQFSITQPVAETILSDGCYAAVGSSYVLNGGAMFAANTVLEAAVASGLTGTTGLAFAPAIQVSGDFSSGWTLRFDDGSGGAGEPDFDDLVILLKATP